MIELVRQGNALSCQQQAKQQQEPGHQIDFNGVRHFASINQRVELGKRNT
ncbi:MAG: hypothetical protein OES53_09045 [Xanthomonadales bacterium]|jgi:hypothetical protein|nr:hypothetical protein [Xanthomonadales bacterium]MDH3923192.1 hypothetical protein [Xanthomonadales bacterium]MDH3939361.1 hypothetical protein [Xanthomonadales bacterium]